ncbi:putative mitochondrial protein Pet127 [Lyophyllum shimeji]|uniref:Mitochondrial protein Pet127 n=1 Tax=Lyophyllum shimeji TaxID=47721 RepID=A0A9P3UMA6_LYOSH|nr:putative mitochondrial protein Pet127 [Lyophyllum shimeji]
MNSWTQAAFRLPRPAPKCLTTSPKSSPSSSANLLQRRASTSRQSRFKRLKHDADDEVARAFLQKKGDVSEEFIDTLRGLVNKHRRKSHGLGFTTKPVSPKAKKNVRNFKKLGPMPDYTRLSNTSSASEPTFLPSSGTALGTFPGLKGAEIGWGEDKLRPAEPIQYTSTNVTSSKEKPPHQYNPIPYSRRIEGLLEPSKEPALEDVVPVSAQNPIAKLEHGLDRVLFNPGVHWLKDPRSRVYNFPPYLEIIPKVSDFAFERLGGFIKSSRDEDLWALARRESRTYAGSTSSLSGMLSHIYFLLSGDKEVNTGNLSRHFAKEPRNFTAGQRMPASIVMNYNDGVYAIDSDSGEDNLADKNILTWMGTLLEKFLTTPPEEFAMYMRFNKAPPSITTRPTLRDAYRYAKSERFVMRSQLDCHDPRLPGTGVFDIKTRACLPIRMDLLNFEENSGYLIRSQTGKVESFEREYYDLIRSAFLKYSFQVRIGNMDGVIVAYHNTARMFGFQYISLQEMDEALFGAGPAVGDRVFAKCVGMLELITEEIVNCFPKQSVKCTFEKLEGRDALNVWVQPLEWAGEEEDRPIRQLEVKVSNYLGQDPVRGWTAVASVEQPWTIHWSISKLSSSQSDIKQALQGAKERQFRFYDIPTGWDPESVGQFWRDLSFSGQAPSGEPLEVNLENFRVPGKRIKQLRAMARSGREETRRLASEEMGKPKVWLGGEVVDVVPPWVADVSEVLKEEPAVTVTVAEVDGVGEEEIAGREGVEKKDRVEEMMAAVEKEALGSAGEVAVGAEAHTLVAEGMNTSADIAELSADRSERRAVHETARDPKSGDISTQTEVQTAGKARTDTS